MTSPDSDFETNPIGTMAELERMRQANAPTSPTPAEHTAMWHPMSELPDQPVGTVRNYVLAAKNRERGTVWTFEAHYLNAYMLPPADGYEDAFDDTNEDGERPFTGWHDVTDPEGDEIYTPLSDQYVEYVGWCEMPKFDEAAVNERPMLLSRIRELEEALRGLSNMYTHAWDLADGGGLIMLPPSIERFEASHEAARAALQPEQETAK